MNAINDFLRPYLVNSWMAGSIFDGQMGHLFFATAVVLLAVRLRWNLYCVVPVCFALAAVKEFWFDMNFEVPAQTWDGSGQDFTMYCAGLVLGLLLLALKPLKKG